MTSLHALKNFQVTRGVGKYSKWVKLSTIISQVIYLLKIPLFHERYRDSFRK